ncbi:hypothetical protein P9G49_10420 [Heyndrickxia coagulans]|uniref:hypothetical protein n=1 Tax=Heyndrickxia coagulans TaxID=1398 RepID=UPI001A946AEC|nr:hypothetical protein [Heyndrickxia coagulans]MEC5269495.1 hypothetical protein [Heyndrickxia coagulans]MED4967110.1 hypothetical protein [Heyndrickxia coagulans]
MPGISAPYQAGIARHKIYLLILSIASQVILLFGLQYGYNLSIMVIVIVVPFVLTFLFGKLKRQKA